MKRPEVRFKLVPDIIACHDKHSHHSKSVLRTEDRKKAEMLISYHVHLISNICG